MLTTNLCDMQGLFFDLIRKDIFERSSSCYNNAEQLIVNTHIKKEWVGRSPAYQAGGKSEQDRATVVVNGHPG